MKDPGVCFQALPRPKKSARILANAISQCVQLTTAWLLANMGNTMNKKQEIEELEKKLNTLDNKIKEVEDRLPAHGIKPSIMTELFELEDEREAVFKQIETLKRRNSEKQSNDQKKGETCVKDRDLLFNR